MVVSDGDRHSMNDEVRRVESEGIEATARTPGDEAGRDTSGALSCG